MPKRSGLPLQKTPLHMGERRKSYTWYGLFDNGYDLEYSEHNFGTIDHFMEPKHVYTTYAAIVRLFVEASFQRQITSEGSPWLFAFTAPDSALLAHWNAVRPQAQASMPQCLKERWQRVNIRSRRQRKNSLLCLDESALFTITETGQVVKLYGAKGFGMSTSRYAGDSRGMTSGLYS